MTEKDFKDTSLYKWIMHDTRCVDCKRVMPDRVYASVSRDDLCHECADDRVKMYLTVALILAFVGLALWDGEWVAAIIFSLPIVMPALGFGIEWLIKRAFGND